MKYLLAIDQGTTSSRTILFDLEGRLVSVAQREFPQYYPHPGWVEHEPEEIWQSQLGTIREVLARSSVSPKEVAAIGITNQRETTLVWERKTGSPLHRAIVWQDRRTANFTDRLRQNGLEPRIREKTGLVLDPYFSASKLAWLLEHVPGLQERAEAGEVCFGNVDTWLMYRLSGGRIYATDVTNASRTQLFNLQDLAWDPELLDVFGIPRAMLPEVKPSSGIFGETDPGLLGRAIEITGVAGDQQAALFGQACFEPGMAKNTYGTGAFVVMNTGRKPVFGEGVLTTLAWQIGKTPPVYALEGSIFVAGAAVQWLRDGLGLIQNAGEVEDLARSVTNTEGVYFVPALTGLGAPWWDPYARGLIIGLTRGSTKAHIARAALEAMAYQTADVIDVMQSAGGIRLRELRVDGGAAANDLVLQFQADVLETPVVRPRGTEVSALGAAYLAGLGIGLLDLETIADHWAVERRCEPQMDRQVVCELRKGWQRAVERSRGWAKFDGPR
ncbi:MAG: glycerol kinase GlpK [Deltaproteobacteria bacterium]|jgi:glycerol kinase|nr:MAG: glycerol kinase GlpK [Deltaproteobacteria bacterium]